MGVRAKIVVALALAAVVALATWTTLHGRRSTAAPVTSAAPGCAPRVRTTAQEDEPQRPLRRDGFERLFGAGTPVRAGGKPARVETVDVARLDLPTGRLVAGDPTNGADIDTPFIVTVPPGTYPVSLATVRFADDGTHVRVAAAKLLLRPEPVTRWVMGLVPGNDPATLGPNQFFGYGVDSGLGAFLDASAVPSLCGLLGDDLDGPLMKALDARTGSPGAAVRESPDGPNVIAFESGWGDGAYPTWIGYTAAGEVAQFVTDFDVID
jgi:hypothetical protein